jgi:hypothetical protein
MSRKEFLRDPIEYEWLFDKGSTSSPKQPATVLQVLQESAPHAVMPISAEERFHLRELIIDTLETLTDMEIWIINALLFERMSLRRAGFILGIPKTTLARKRDAILKGLQEKLLQHEYIKEYLND